MAKIHRKIIMKKSKVYFAYIHQNKICYKESGEDSKGHHHNHSRIWKVNPGYHKLLPQ